MTDYNPNIPQANDLISVSQGQLLNNFSQANVVIAKDHYAFDDTLNGKEGLHQQVTFPSVKASDPTIVSPKGILYTKTSGGDSQLFYENATAVTQLSGLNPVGNIQFRWGLSTANPSTVTFSTPFPNSCLVVVVSSSNGTSNQVGTSGTPTRSNFIVQASVASRSFYYIAIGN
jgi:hypothetical protein